MGFIEVETRTDQWPHVVRHMQTHGTGVLDHRVPVLGKKEMVQLGVCSELQRPCLIPVRTRGHESPQTGTAHIPNSLRNIT